MSGPRGIAGWTLARRLRAALLALSLLLLLAALAILLVLRQADRALSDQTQRSFPARLAASQLLTSLVDQQTGLRGYALSGDKRFLDPYRRGIVNEQAARARLEHYISPDGSARLALLTLDAAITAWRDQYASLRTGEDRRGEADATIEFGSQLFDRVRETSAALDAELAKGVRSAQQRADTDRTLVLVVLGLMVLLVGGAVVVLQRALRSAVLQPMARLAEQVAVVSRGQHSTPIEPVGPPDLREMGEGVESMRRELVRALAEVEAQQRGLQRRAAELARSNADLEQFAYVASHDLQEPLRKVASFCQLIEQRYSGQLDERGEQYIAYAVDGAKRMQRLITDLLTFSRVGRTSAGFASVDLREVTRRAWDGLEGRVQESAATLDIQLDEEASTVPGDSSLLQLLLANLLGNSIKYRRADAAPRIRISSSLDDGFLRVRVDDNGIGIPPEYAEKVFVIFQRLHGRDEYEGTGIGLALAKKIVEFHGGRIAVEPSDLGGTCIAFTLTLEQSPDE